MLKHLRIFWMFLSAFVLIVMASSFNGNVSGRSNDSLRTKVASVRSDHVTMTFESATKTTALGSFKQPTSARRDVISNAKVVAREDSRTDELMLGSGLRAAVERETSTGSSPFTSISHESPGKTVDRADADIVAPAPKSAITMSSATESDAAGAGLLVVYGPVQGADGELLNVLGQQFDLSGLDTSSLDLSAAVGRSAYLEAQQVGEAFRVTRIEIFDEYSVPGASPVLVVGNVTEVDSGIGRLQIGSLEVDTTIMGSDLQFESGRQVSIPGTQPVPGGMILGEQYLVVDANLIGALGSSDVVSISGRSVQGISGSCTRGISGSSRSRNVRGISGSSTRGISGSSAR